MIVNGLKNQIDLSSYVGNNLILVKFVGLNDYGNNLYVDNINVVSIINTDINAEIIESNSIKLFPNPSNKQTNLIFNAKVAGMLNLELSDITGRVIMSKTIDAEKGINNQSIDLSGKSAGI
ncbi:MAG: T9SS type A sorting domain-containing protein [Bacteroidetes bacterium]|nr:T9SS type A sorting domain-containing protein [Bacteroidota bacterium]